MDLATVKNLITYWSLFGSSEIKIPRGAESLIEDTIQALKEYKDILESHS